MREMSIRTIIAGMMRGGFAEAARTFRERVHMYTDNELKYRAGTFTRF